MASIFSIDNIIGKLNVTPLQPAYFQVRITTKHLLGLIPNDSISLLCMRASLPGISIQANPVRQSGVGNNEKRPADVDFQDFSTSFICDGKGEIVKFFHRWMQSIYKFDAENGLNSQLGSGLKTYTFEYPDTYEASIEITQYQVGNDSDKSSSKQGTNRRTAEEQPAIVYKFYRAYPHTIGTMETDWNTRDEFHVLPVSFYYQSWSSNYLESGTSYDVPSTYLPPSLDYAKSGMESAYKAVGDFITGGAPKGSSGK